MLTTKSSVRRFECTLPAGEILPGEHFDISARVVAPEVGTDVLPLVFYCQPGGQMNRDYFDIGSDDDRRFSFAEAMALRGIVTIVADHPGIGYSTTPEDEYHLTPDLMAAAHVGAARTAFAELRAGRLVHELAAMPDLVAIGCGHSMGAVMTIDCQALEPVFSGLVLLGYGTGGVTSALPAELREAARDPEWLRANLPRLAQEMFGSARSSGGRSQERRRSGGGGPSFHEDAADPDGRALLRGARAPLLTMAGLYSMFPGVSDKASSQIKVPVLVVTGTHDFALANEDLRRQFPSTPAFELFRPDDAGHNLFVFPSRTASFEYIVNWALKYFSS